MIDISLPLKNGIITFPGDMPYEEYEFKTYRKDKVHITRVIMETHSGTHFDAPFHMIENGKKASEIDIERFIGKATVVEVRGDEIDAGDIPDNVEKIVLFKTKNSDMYSEFRTDFTYLNLAGARKLVAHGVKVVGIDYLSVEKFHSNREVHIALLSNDAVIVEGLYLKDVTPGTYDFVCLPLKMGQDGAPCRAVLL